MHEKFVEMMISEKDSYDEWSPVLYHIHLVKLLASCTEGKNANTEIKCHSLLSLDDIVRVVADHNCIAEVCDDLDFWGKNVLKLCLYLQNI